jgi:hypothetical protein
MQHVWKKEVYTGFCWGILRERDHSEDPGVDGRITLKWIFKKWDVAWTGFILLRIWTGEWGNKPSGSIKCGELLDWLMNCQLVKKD